MIHPNISIKNPPQYADSQLLGRIVFFMEITYKPESLFHKLYSLSICKLFCLFKGNVDMRTDMVFSDDFVEMCLLKYCMYLWINT